MLASGVTQIQDGSVETWWEVFYQREDFYLKRGRSQQDITLLKWTRPVLETCSYAKTKVACTLMLVYGNLCRFLLGRISLWSTTCLQRHFLPLVTFAWGYKKGTAGLATKSHKKSPVLRERESWKSNPVTRMNPIKHPGFSEHPAMETNWQIGLTVRI